MFVNRLLPIRLPKNEMIRVWAVGMDGASEVEESQSVDGVTIVARHDVWFYGVEFQTLRYQIWKTSKEHNPDKARVK
jgi:hypothetical protein